MLKVRVWLSVFPSLLALVAYGRFVLFGFIVHLELFDHALVVELCLMPRSFAYLAQSIAAASFFRCYFGLVLGSKRVVCCRGGTQG